MEIGHKLTGGTRRSCGVTCKRLRGDGVAVVSDCDDDRDVNRRFRDGLGDAWLVERKKVTPVAATTRQHDHVGPIACSRRRKNTRSDVSRIAAVHPHPRERDSVTPGLLQRPLEVAERATLRRRDHGDSP
jgi:hypothetical protein